MSGPWPSSAPHDAVGCDRRHRLPLSRRRQLSGAVLAIAARRRGGHQRDAPRSFRRRQRLRSGSGTQGQDVHAPGRIRRGDRPVRRAFFGFSPREASRIDPQHRLLLEIAYEAVEDAGLSADRLAGSRTGVFVGFSAHDYSSMQMYPFNRHLIDSHSNTGGATSIAANRISYMLDLRGPSFIVDTACSSSLTAVHLAMRSLRNGECDLALAGGAQLNLTPEIDDRLLQGLDDLARRPLPCVRRRARTAMSAAKAAASSSSSRSTRRSPTAIASTPCWSGRRSTRTEASVG